VPNVRLAITVAAPKPHPLFSTDLPVVEGTRLIQTVLEAPEGVAQFTWVWPLRGEYTFTVRAEPAQGGNFTPVTQELRIRINENPQKVPNLLILLAVLLVFGLVSGFVLGRSATRVGGVA